MGAVRAYLRRRLHPDDVDDALVDVFSIAWRRVDQIPDGPDARLWLFGVARNVKRNVLRSAVRRSRLRSKLEGLIDEPVPTPEVYVMQRAEHSLVHQALDRLRPSDQEILRLRTWEELTRQEMATALGISPEAVDMRLNRAAKRMEKALVSVGYTRGATSPRAVENGGRA